MTPQSEIPTKILSVSAFINNLGVSDLASHSAYVVTIPTTFGSPSMGIKSRSFQFDFNIFIKMGGKVLATGVHRVAFTPYRSILTAPLQQFHRVKWSNFSSNHKLAKDAACKEDQAD